MSMSDNEKGELILGERGAELTGLTELVEGVETMPMLMLCEAELRRSDRAREDLRRPGRVSVFFKGSLVVAAAADIVPVVVELGLANVDVFELDAFEPDRGVRGPVAVVFVLATVVVEFPPLGVLCVEFVVLDGVGVVGVDDLGVFVVVGDSPEVASADTVGPPSGFVCGIVCLRFKVLGRKS